MAQGRSRLPFAVKPLSGIFIALCLFGLAAGLAWLTGSAAQQSGGSSRIAPVMRSTGVSSGNTPALVIKNLEEELRRGPERWVEDYSREELDKLDTGESLGDGFRGPNQGLAYASRWAAHDPEAVFAWIERRGFMPGLLTMDQSREFVSVLFEAWIEKTPEDALAAAVRFSRPAHRAQALALVLQNLWRSDPARARELIAQHAGLLASGPERVLRYEKDDLGPVDLEFLKSLPPGPARGKLLAGLLSDSAQSDSVWDSSKTESANHAAAFWNSAPDDLKRELVAGGFSLSYAQSYEDQSAGRKVPLLGADVLLREHAEATGDFFDLLNFAEGPAKEWARRDLEAAFAWTQAHLKGETRLELSAELFRQTAASDFDHAVEVWQSLPDGVLKARAAGTLTGGAPEERKAEAQAIMDGLSTAYREIARGAVTEVRTLYLRP